jgi:hypothetical protein
MIKTANKLKRIIFWQISIWINLLLLLFLRLIYRRIDLGDTVVPYFIKQKA